LAFIIVEKGANEIWLFLAFLGQLDFLCRFGRFKGDFDSFLGRPATRGGQSCNCPLEIFKNVCIC